MRTRAITSEGRIIADLRTARRGFEMSTGAAEVEGFPLNRGLD